MYKILPDLKKPQKLKYRGFAWKTEEKPFMAFETDEYKDALKMINKWLEDSRDFGVNCKDEKKKN